MAHSGRNGLVSRRQHQIVPSWSSALSSRQAHPGSTDLCGPGTSLVQRRGVLKMRLRLSKLKGPNAPYLPLGPAQHKATGIRTPILVLASNSAGPSSPGLRGRSARPRACVTGAAPWRQRAHPDSGCRGLSDRGPPPALSELRPKAPVLGRIAGVRSGGRGMVVRPANSPAP